MNFQREIYRDWYGQDIVGDGNCFYRCLSLFLNGDQKYFGDVRRGIVEFMSNDEKQTKAEKIKRYRQLMETEGDYDKYVQIHRSNKEYATDPLIQAGADKYSLHIYISKYCNGSFTPQLLKASPVQLGGKDRMSGKDRVQLYLKLKDDHYTFEKEEHIISNEDEWCDLITPLSNRPDRFVDDHFRLALDNTKKDTSAFPAAKENLRSGMDISEDEKKQKDLLKRDVDMKLVKKINNYFLRTEAENWKEGKLPNNLAVSQEQQQPPVRIKSVSHGGLPNKKPKKFEGQQTPFISLKSNRKPTYSKDVTENCNKDDSCTNFPTEKVMDISSIHWKKLMKEGENSLRELIKAKRIGFGTIFKVERKPLNLFEYVHFFMLMDIHSNDFTVVQVDSTFKGVIFKKSRIRLKLGENSLFDFSRGVFYDEYFVKEIDEKAVRLRVKFLQSLCIEYGFGPKRWNCESAINYVRFGTKLSINRSEADIFRDRYLIRGRIFLGIVEGLATGVYAIAHMIDFCKTVKFRYCTDTVCKVPLIVTPGLFLPSCQQANSSVSN